MRSVLLVVVVFVGLVVTSGLQFLVGGRDMVWGAVIGAGASLAGSLLSAKSAADSRQAQEEQAERNAALQREFAQHGIRWRVEDAKAAGIHPLFALGAPAFQASPSQIFPAESNSGALLAQAGQDIGRAIDSTRTDSERVAARLDALSLERAELQNDLLRSQISRLNAQSGPPFPDPGNPGQRVFGTADARIVEQPLERITAAPGAPWQESGAVTDFGFSKTPTGYAVVPSKDFKERAEDQLIPELAWALRNHLLPSVSKSHGTPPPKSWLPLGATHWAWSVSKQEWQPAGGDPYVAPRLKNEMRRVFPGGRISEGR